MPAVLIGPNTQFPWAGIPATPKDMMDGCILQLDPDDTGITEGVSGIDFWPDQSGENNNGVQATDADRPAHLIGGGINGHNAVEFDGANTESLDFTITDASTDYTVLCVLDNTAPTVATNMCLWDTNATNFAFQPQVTSKVNVLDGVNRAGEAAKLGEQILTWRTDTADTSIEYYRDGVRLAKNEAYTARAFNGATALGQLLGGAQPLYAKISYLLVFNRKLTDAELAIIHTWLASRFAITFDFLSIANCGAWWDLDYSTEAGGVLTGLTDLALGGALTIAGSPAIVTIGGQKFVRMDGVDDVIWMADKAALDGATGCTHVLKHANCESLPVNANLAQKGRAALHFNGGLTGQASSGTRFTAAMHSADVVDAGPLAEFTTPAESIACAMESGVAVRRVDGDGTYASTVTAATTQVGAGALSWGAREAAGPVFDFFMEIDLRRAAYYNRPLNEYELKAAQAYADAA
jgi:hypothetical protein